MEKLLIKQLSKSNEAVGLITCLPQKINVLRALDPQDLLPYKRALTFTPGPERFTIEQDGKKLAIDNFNYIGFGDSEILTPDNSRRFANLLSNKEIPQIIFENLGLKDTRNKIVTDLTACEIRRLAILELAVTHSRIYVLINLFDPINNSLRENIAEFIADVCATQEHILIIPELTYRPNCWIDNQNIQRIEVGQNLQKTIGMGSTSSELQAMLEEVRQSAQSKPDTKQDSMLDVSLDDQIPPVFNKSKNKLGKYLVLPVIAAIAVGGYFYQKNDEILPASEAIKVVEPNQTTIKVPAKVDKNQVVETIIKKESATATKAVDNPPKEMKTDLILDQYPKDLKDSILATYSGSSKSIDYQNQKAKAIEPPKTTAQSSTVSAGESLFEALKKTAGTGKTGGTVSSYGSSGADTNQQSGNESLMDASDEERREILREKFRAALERAAQR